MDEYIEREAISEEIRKYYYKNPPNFSYGEGFDRGLDRAQRAILDAPAADVAPVRRWIPVTERLPDNKEHDWVLAQVVEKNGFMHIPKVMEYRQSKNDWYEETYGWLSEHNGVFTVTHWMPLPEPPKEETP